MNSNSFYISKWGEMLCGFSIAEAARQIGVAKHAMEMKVKRGTIEYFLVNRGKGDRAYITDKAVAYEGGTRDEKITKKVVAARCVLLSLPSTDSTGNATTVDFVIYSQELLGWRLWRFPPGECKITSGLKKIAKHQKTKRVKEILEAGEYCCQAHPTKDGYSLMISQDIKIIVVLLDTRTLATDAEYHDFKRRFLTNPDSTVKSMFHKRMLHAIKETPKTSDESNQ